MLARDAAAEIRKQLKAHGWAGRQVSVRCGGSSVTVTIKDPRVPMSVVEPIARSCERISRCEMTGEILSGGNIYISVSYDYDVVKAKAAEVEPLLSDEPGVPVQIEGIEVWRVMDRSRPKTSEYNYMVVGGDAYPANAYDRQSAAREVAVAIMARGYQQHGRWVLIGAQSETPADPEPTPEPETVPEPTPVPAELRFDVESIADCTHRLCREYQGATNLTLGEANTMLLRVAMGQPDAGGYGKVHLRAHRGDDSWTFRIDPDHNGGGTDIERYARDYLGRLERILKTYPDHWAAPNVALFRSLLGAIEETK